MELLFVIFGLVGGAFLGLIFYLCAIPFFGLKEEIESPKVSIVGLIPILIYFGSGLFFGFIIAAQSFPIAIGFVISIAWIYSVAKNSK